MAFTGRLGKANLRCPQAILEGPHMDIVIAHSLSPALWPLLPPPSLPPHSLPLPPEACVHSFIYSVRLRLVIADCQYVLQLNLKRSERLRKKTNQPRRLEKSFSQLVRSVLLIIEIVPAGKTTQASDFSYFLFDLKTSVGYHCL